MSQGVTVPDSQGKICAIRNGNNRMGPYMGNNL
jgi:hypothetical protein